MTYLLLIIGFLTGVLTGLTGASGMSVLISGLLLAGFDIHEVIGLTFAVTFFNTVAAIPPYLKEKKWDLVVTFAVGIPAFFAVFFGHSLGRGAPSGILSGVVMIALLGAGVRFLMKKKDGKSGQSPRQVPFVVLILLGVVLGTIMGIMGGGGSIFINLLLVFVFRLPIRVALGSSIIIVGMAAIPGIILNYQGDQLDLLSAALLIIPGMGASWFASKWAHRVVERKIEVLLGAYLVIISLVLFYSRILSPALGG